MVAVSGLLSGPSPALANRLHVQHRALRETGSLEKPVEAGHVAHQRLLLHLLAKVAKGTGLTIDEFQQLL
jgi:hypothetical protein